MDANEDSLSFKSANNSDSDDQEFLDPTDISVASASSEVFSPLLKSGSQTSIQSRSSGSYHQILPKRTTPKRRAPQPPSSKVTPTPPAKEEEFLSQISTEAKEKPRQNSMTSFANSFRASELGSIGSSKPQIRSPESSRNQTATSALTRDQVSPQSETPVKSSHVPKFPAYALSNIASHPVILNTKPDHDANPQSASFSNLQIRLIDDESDAEPDRSIDSKKSDPPHCSTVQDFPIPTLHQNLLVTDPEHNSGLVSSSPISSVNILSSMGLTTTTYPHQAGLSMNTLPIFQNHLQNFPIYENAIMSHNPPGTSGSFTRLPTTALTNPYISPLSMAYPYPISPYYNHSQALVASTPTLASPHPAILPPPDGDQEDNSTTVQGSLAITDSPHSSDFSRRSKDAFLTSSSAYSDLNRLSEGEEEDDFSDGQGGDHSPPSSHSWDYVNKGRRALQRSDSIVTVAHIYEDLLVSQRFKIKVTLTNLTLVVIIAAFFIPNSAALLFSAFRLVFGTLFPAYYSYKAVRTKNIQEYVKWMMYWIVFAFFTCVETITDVLLSFWFPFYYELKILVVLWLLSPATKGSSILYRKFVHPWLSKRENEIDDCITKAKQQGYSTVVQLGTKGVNYATNIIMQSAIKGGGGIVNQLKRSCSMNEISEDVADMNRNVKPLPPPPKDSIEDDDRSISSGSYESEPRHRSESESTYHRPRGHSTGRTARSSKTRSADVSDVYFHDVQDSIPQRRSPRTHEPSNSISGTVPHQTTTRRARTGEVSSYATLPRAASKRAAAKKRQM